MAKNKSLTVGCFEVEFLGSEPPCGPRWRVKNTRTTFTHTTFGTEGEVVEQLTLQSVAWERRFNPVRTKQRGSAWRNKPTYQKKTKEGASAD
jgi:hypothetical protein